MKKRTTITTEKREIWIISGGRVVRETPCPSSDASTDIVETLIPSGQIQLDEITEDKIKEATTPLE